MVTTQDSYQRLEADVDLANILEVAREQRFGQWCVRLQDLNLYCHDLLSLYHAAKDIFINKIYDFETEREKPLVIDAGAHIGLFTIFCRRKFPDARMLLFEPDTESLGLLTRNLEANGCSDVTLVRAGLYKDQGEMPFFCDHSDGSTMYVEDAPLRISVERLSTHLTEPVAFMKMNIEGAELDVIREAAPRLPHIDRMVIEYHGFPELGQNLHPILGILADAGFRYMIHDFDGVTNPATKPPFWLNESRRFFLLIYAQKLYKPRPAASLLGGAHHAFRTEPVSRIFGYDRGRPIDRYYIEKFLDAEKKHIKGRVLEMGGSMYTHRFGRGVTQSDVLGYEANDNTTIVGNLVTGENIPEGVFDCIILTQTLNVIYDVKSALRHCRKALAPGGVLLVTVPCISQISRYDMDRWGDYWRFTDRSFQMLLMETLKADEIDMKIYGNLAVARAFLEGLALEEMDPEILDEIDLDYQVILAAKVRL